MTTEIIIPVKESWFESFKMANLNMPQHDFGIRTSVLYSIIADPVRNWQEFAKTEFTSDQSSELLKLMGVQHRSREIPVSPDPNSKPSVKVVTEDQIAKLWRNFRTSIFRVVSDFTAVYAADETISEIDRNDHIAFADSADQFFSNPQNRENARTFTRTAAAANYALKAPYIEDMYRIYRLCMDRRKNAPSQLQVNPDVLQVMVDNQITIPGPIEAMSLQAYTYRRIIERADEQIVSFMGPDVYIDWLYAGMSSEILSRRRPLEVNGADATVIEGKIL